MNAGGVEAQAFDAGISLELIPPQPLAGSPNPLPLRSAHAAEAAGPSACAAGSDLDDEHQLGTSRDDVELEPPEPQVPMEDCEPRALQVTSDLVLCPSSERCALTAPLGHGSILADAQAGNARGGGADLAPADQVPEIGPGGVPHVRSSGPAIAPGPGTEHSSRFKLFVSSSEPLRMQYEPASSD
jgi:hypothetical protein